MKLSYKALAKYLSNSISIKCTKIWDQWAHLVIPVLGIIVLT